MERVLAFMCLFIFVSCGQLSKKLNDQLVLGKEKPAASRMPASLGLPYIQKKSHLNPDQEFQNECSKSGGEFKYSGCVCNKVYFNPFITTCFNQ